MWCRNFHCVRVSLRPVHEEATDEVTISVTDLGPSKHKEQLMDKLMVITETVSCSSPGLSEH